MTQPDTDTNLCGWFADTVAPDSCADSQLTVNQEDKPLAAPMAVTMESGSPDTMDCIDEDVKLDPKFIASVMYVLQDLRNDTWLLC